MLNRPTDIKDRFRFLAIKVSSPIIIIEMVLSPHCWHEAHIPEFKYVRMFQLLWLNRARYLVHSPMRKYSSIWLYFKMKDSMVAKWI